MEAVVEFARVEIIRIRHPLRLLLDVVQVIAQQFVRIRIVRHGAGSEGEGGDAAAAVQRAGPRRAKAVSAGNLSALVDDAVVEVLKRMSEGDDDTSSGSLRSVVEHATARPNFT